MSARSRLLGEANVPDEALNNGPNGHHSRTTTGFAQTKRAQLRRFGVGNSLRAWVVRALKKGFADFNLAQVGTSYAGPHPAHPDYPMALIDWDRFQACLGRDAHRHRAAFTRGDLCLASFLAGQPDTIVGYNFYTSAPTAVNDEVTFVFPDRYRYSYGAFTHPDHRGKGLSPARFEFFRQWRRARNDPKDNVYYIDVDNLPSMVSGMATSTREILGYIGYVRVRPSGPLRCFASPKARRTGVAFALTRSRDLTSA